MKRMKKGLSIMLIMALLLNLTVPAMAANIVRNDYEAALIGTDTQVNGRNAIKFEFQVHGDTVGGQEQAMIKYNLNQFDLITISDANVVNPGSKYALIEDTVNYDNVAEKAHNSVQMQEPLLYGQSVGDYAIVAMAVSVNGGTPKTTCASGLTGIGSFYLGLKDGVNYSDLDSSSVQWVTAAEAGACNQNCVLYVNDGSVDIGFRIFSTTDNEFGENPVLSYTGSDIRALAKVDVKLDKVSINTPVELPEAGETVTVASTVKAYDVNDVEFTEADNVSYAYSLAMKDSSELSDKITVDENGVISVAAGAPEGTLVFTATGTYTKTNGADCTAVGTAELVLSHGNATTNAPTDPTPNPGEVDPDVEKVFSGVKVTKDGDTVVTSATGSSYTEPIGIPTGVDTTVTFVGAPVDQYGDEITGLTGSWDDTVTTGTGTTVNNGVVTVAVGADAADFDYAFTATQDTKTYTAKVNVVVNNTIVKWPAITNNTIVYGQPISDLTFDTTDATVMDQGTDVTSSATFAWDVDDTAALLNAGTDKLTMKVSFTDSASDPQTMTKAFDIVVNKADQVISIAQDGDTATTLVNVEIGLDTDLAPTVGNKTVADAPGAASAVSYGVLGGNTALVEFNNGIVKGMQLSANDDDLATMTITAEGNDNYNEASREISFYVSNQMLRAQIVFDLATPVAGQNLTATVTESTNPVQDGSLFDGSGVMINGLMHKWLRWDGVEGHDPVEIEAPGSTMTQPDTAVEEIKVVYQPTAADVGNKLILTIITPTGASSYPYMDKSSATTENAVIKGTPGAPGLSIQGKTTSTITVTPVDGGEYAILNKDGSAVAAVADEFDPGSVDADTLAWQDSNEFANLTPNTEYEVYVRLKGTDVANTSDYTTMEVKTDAISIDPENPSTDPAVVFTTEPSVTITGDAKFGQTLTADLTDAVITIDGEAVSGPFYTEYQWYRNIPATETEEAREEAITDATGATYQLTADDIGNTIIVKVTPATDSPYTGLVSSDPTATVTKADATLAVDGFATTPVSSATATDGTITIEDPADATAAYEIRLKAADGAEENAWADATVTPAADGAPAYIGGLSAGTYELRLKETATASASNAIELTVSTLGHNISGKIISMNAAKGMTYTLLDADGNEVEGHKDVALTLSTPEGALTGRVQQSFSIESVPDGVYTLVIKKGVHLDLNIKNVVVNGADLDLTPYHALFEMGEGDLDGNGMINGNDKNVVTRVANFNLNISAGVQNEEADLDGNGAINGNDSNIITAVRNFNKRTSDFDVTISYESAE